MSLTPNSNPNLYSVVGMSGSELLLVPIAAFYITEFTSRAFDIFGRKVDVIYDKNAGMVHMNGNTISLNTYINDL